jgi:DNA ligase-1
LAANPTSSPSRIVSSPAPLSQYAKRKENQTTGAAKPATVEDESEKSSSEDEGEDEIDAEDAEESTSDKVTNTKRFDSNCAKKDVAHLCLCQCSIRPNEKGRSGHRRWMESWRAVRISFNIENKVSPPISVPYAALTKAFSLIEATTKRLEKTAILTSFLLLVIQRSKKNDPKSLLQAVYLCINRVRIALAT